MPAEAKPDAALIAAPIIPMIVSDKDSSHILPLLERHKDALILLLHMQNTRAHEK